MMKYHFNMLDEKKRANVVGGSEISTLFACNPYMNLIELWKLKLGFAKRNNKDLSYGNKAEPLIIAEVNARLNKSFRHNRICKHFIHPQHIHIGCTPDSLSETELLQCKTNMKKAYIDPPLHYKLQTLYEMFVLQNENGYLAIANTDFKHNIRNVDIFSFTRDYELEKMFVERVNKFWEFVENKEIPNLNYFKSI